MFVRRLIHWIASSRRGGRSVSRVAAAAGSGAGLIMLCVAGTGLALASANAPDPTGTGGQSVQNSDGSVTVKLVGDWSWDSINTGGNGKTSPQLQCDQRYAVGFAVDWADPTTLPWSSPTTDVISANGITFQAAPNYDNVVTDLCKNVAADGAPQGTAAGGNQWQASHTYPSAKDVPSIICVNVYDMHGKANSPSTNQKDYIAAGSGHNQDNSIETNSFNPAIGGNCFKTPPIVNPNPPTMTVQKTNNADQTPGDFQQTETEKVQGQDVLFKVVVTNTSTNNLVIDSISDTYGSTTTTPTCDNNSTNPFVGGTLSAASSSGQNGGSATCYFTIPNYLGNSTSALTDTITVKAHDTNNQQTTGTSTSTVNPPAPTQNIVGKILACTGGVQTSTVVTGGHISVPNAGGSFVGGSDFGPQFMPAGTFPMSATAPNGYQFVPCGQSGVTFTGTPATGATQQVVVPSGGTGTGRFYVTPISATTQTIAGSILACSPSGQPTTTQVQGGSLSVSTTAGQQLFTAVNQLSATQVPADTYTLAATAPSGYQFISCGQTGVTIPTTANPVNASQPVTVPSGGAGDGVFYVSPVPGQQQQTIAGQIYVCGANNTPTTTLVGGGTLTAAMAGTDVVTSNNPLVATQVPAGTYSLNATVPSGYQLVQCGVVGGPGTSFSNNNQSASQTLVVPSGGAVQGVFYAQPVSNTTQTIGGSILLCGADGNPTNTLAGGGTLTASLNGTPVVSLANPMAPTQVAAGNYVLAANAPAGYQFVSCNQSGVNISTPPTTANQPIAVNPGTNPTGVFYVTPTPVPNNPPTQTIGGSILLCGTNGSPTSQLVNGGVITVVNSAGSTVDSVYDQLTAITVPAGTYQVTGNAPSGYTFVQCGTNVTPNGNTETQTVGVAPGSTNSATFYVQPVAVQGLTLTNQPQPTQSVAPATVTPATEVAGLAFTGAPSQLRWVLVAGLALLSGGLFMLWFTRPRLAQ